jgi:uncharacterized protein
MSQRDFPRGLEVPSPCVNVCQMDEQKGLCRGCYRTIDEIAHWSVLDADEKRVVWRAIELRRRAIG